MELTIVIVNWNSGELLLRCLRSVQSSLTSFQVKVIVVDNDSHDGSREAAQREFPEFHIFNSGANLGFGRANNLARPLTDTPLVLFLNPDTELRADTLEGSVRCLRERPDVGALGCKMCDPDGSIQEQGIQWHLTPWRALLELLVVTRDNRKRLAHWLPTLDPNRSSYVCKLYGGYLLCRKDVLDQAGWFDERYFMYAEDGDLSRTVESLGWRLYYTADVEIIHVAGGTSAKAPSNFSVLMKQDSIAKMMRKFYGDSAVLRFRLAIALGASVRLVGLSILRCAAFFRASGSTQRLQNSLFKHWLLLLWSLGLKHASPPT